MVRQSMIIIGGGLAGLSTGSYAQMNGYDSEIMEHHSLLGGVCTSWKRNGYTIDGCIHFLMAHKPGRPQYELFKELAGESACQKFFDLKAYGKFIDLKENISIAITEDMQKFERDLKSAFPNDDAVIDTLMSGIHGMKGFYMPVSTPWSLMPFHEKMRQIWRMRKSFKYFGGKWRQSAEAFAKNCKHPALKNLIENIFMPSTPMFFNLMILACLADHDLGHIHGGPTSLVLPIKKKYCDLGGKIKTNARVVKIVTKDNKACGVKLSDGSEHFADIIISAADGCSTIYDMLDGKYIDASIEKRFKTWPMFKPLLMISYGTTVSLKDEVSNQFIRLAKPFSVNNQMIDQFLVRIFNYDSELNPPSKTVVQVEIESDFDYWNTLVQKNRREYDREKENVAKIFREKLELVYPKISAHIDMVDVATPYTLWRYTLNHKGAFEGWVPSAESFSSNVKKTLPGLSNFYMAGQWVEPGGGILPAMYSGRHVIQYVCRDDKKKFKITCGSFK